LPVKTFGNDRQDGGFRVVLLHSKHVKADKKDMSWKYWNIFNVSNRTTRP